MAASSLKWGVLGVAEIATAAFAPAITKSKTSSLYAVASRDAARARAFGAQFGAAKIHQSYEALLEDHQVEVVYVPLPNTLHYEWILKCIDAGKHVLCEKPLVLRPSQVDEIAARSSKAGVKVMEAFMYRFHPRIVRLKELLKSGVIGDVHMAKAFYCYKLGAASDGSGNIRLDNALGGGALLDVGCYCIDALLYYLGSEPVSISTWSQSPGASGVELRAGGLIEFASGQVGEFFCAMDTFGGGHVELWGSSGKITLPAAFRLRANQTDLPLIVETPAGVFTENFAYADQYLAEIDAFAASVTGNGPVAIPLMETRRNVAVLEAARMSWEKRTFVSLV